VLAWTITVVLGVLSILLIVGNYANSLRAHFDGRSYSWVPFLGGVSGALALWVCPLERSTHFAWVPLLVDLSIPGFLIAFVVYRSFWK
jgi:hypothetical protein